MAYVTFAGQVRRARERWTAALLAAGVILVLWDPAVAADPQPSTHSRSPRSGQPGTNVGAADLPPVVTAVMAATQRPVAAAAFSDVSGPPAWKKLPCWAVVATGDKAAGADVVRSMAQRAHADIVEVEGSHVIMISQPQAVTDHILTAARAVADAHR